MVNYFLNDLTWILYLLIFLSNGKSDQIKDHDFLAFTEKPRYKNFEGTGFYNGGIYTGGVFISFANWRDWNFGIYNGVEATTGDFITRLLCIKFVVSWCVKDVKYDFRIDFEKNLQTLVCDHKTITNLPKWHFQVLNLTSKRSCLTNSPHLVSSKYVLTNLINPSLGISIFCFIFLRKGGEK